MMLAEYDCQPYRYPVSHVEFLLDHGAQIVPWWKPTGCKPTKPVFSNLKFSSRPSLKSLIEAGACGDNQDPCIAACTRLDTMGMSGVDADKNPGWSILKVQEPLVSIPSWTPGHMHHLYPDCEELRRAVLEGTQRDVFGKRAFGTVSDFKYTGPILMLNILRICEAVEARQYAGELSDEILRTFNPFVSKECKEQGEIIRRNGGTVLAMMALGYNPSCIEDLEDYLRGIPEGLRHIVHRDLQYYLTENAGCTEEERRFLLEVASKCNPDNASGNYAAWKRAGNHLAATHPRYLFHRGGRPARRKLDLSTKAIQRRVEQIIESRGAEYFHRMPLIEASRELGIIGAKATTIDRSLGTRAGIAFRRAGYGKKRSMVHGDRQARLVYVA